tara:strand:- start:5095 stop:5688 length:594 start_codon:yes stop_codon:yes gene_type:complete
MEGSELARFKDNVLEELLKHSDKIDALSLYKQIGEPLDNYNHFETIVEEMLEHFKRYIQGDNSTGRLYIIATVETKQFLKEGGFVLRRKKEIEANGNLTEMALRPGRIERLTEERLKQDIRKNKYWWMPIAVSIVSVAIAIASYFRPSNNITKDKFKELQDEVEGLRIDFNEENNNLKDRLYKAEMLIAVYESDTTN